MASLANLVDETNGRFWAQTGHKKGRKLDMSDPTDRAMAKVWLAIYAAVRGHRENALREAQRLYGETFTPHMLVFERPDGSRRQATFASRGRLDTQYNWHVNQIDTYRYIAAFDFTQNTTGPVYDSFSPYAYEWEARQLTAVGASPWYTTSQPSPSRYAPSQASSALRRRPSGPWRPRPRPY